MKVLFDGEEELVPPTVKEEPEPVFGTSPGTVPACWLAKYSKAPNPEPCTPMICNV